MSDRTPRSERLHIAIFGRRNAGKSSLINALTNQDIALVSDVPGTTTDPVYKAMEILPLGPVVIIDTAGIDDVGSLGELRVQRTLSVMRRTDLALLVVDATARADTQVSDGQALAYEQGIVEQLRARQTPALGVLNKIDLVPPEQVRELQERLSRHLNVPFLAVSSLTRDGVDALKMEIVRLAPADWAAPSIVGDLLNPGDVAVLVVPIDLAAPKGRLILPQVQTLRDILDHDACGVIVKERELRYMLDSLARRPRIVITDSQVFAKVSADTPRDVWLTSFSILFARYKGDLPELVRGAKAIDDLEPGDRVLIAEACTHHPVADDIGRVKIPRWLRQRVGGELEAEVRSGLDFPPDLQRYRLIVHCGGCMINRREMLYRIMQARQAGIPIVNYGVAIAYLHGILPRVLEPFPAALLALEE
ncbi:MAG TPA: [FeFe] hydrogenase H-cluster maturation GTPase HydF [Firmicutes bacterium]|nr:[FeFe] hydrogenase H-cluster maturation GTPase HydF [Bacillota bacterium]